MTPANSTAAALRSSAKASNVRPTASGMVAGPPKPSTPPSSAAPSSATTTKSAGKLAQAPLSSATSDAKKGPPSSSSSPSPSPPLSSPWAPPPSTAPITATPSPSKPATGPNRGGRTTAKPSSSLAVTLPPGLPSTASSNWSYVNSNNVTNINETQIRTNVTNVTEVNVVNNYYTQVLPDGKTDTVTVPHLETRTRSVTHTYTKTPDPTTVTRTESGRIVTSTVSPSRNAGTTAISTSTATATTKPGDAARKVLSKSTPTPTPTSTSQESGTRSKAGSSSSRPSPLLSTRPTGSPSGARIIPNALGGSPASSASSSDKLASSTVKAFSSITISSAAPSPSANGNRVAGAQTPTDDEGDLDLGGDSDSAPSAPTAPSAPSSPSAPIPPSAPSSLVTLSAPSTGATADAPFDPFGPLPSSGSQTSFNTPMPTMAPAQATLEPSPTISLASLSSFLSPGASSSSPLISNVAPSMSTPSSTPPLGNLPTMAPGDADKKGSSNSNSPAPLPASTTSGVSRGMHRDASGHLVADSQSQLKGSSSNHSSTAGIVVGVIAAVLLLAFGLFFLLHHRRRQRQNRMPWSRDAGGSAEWCKGADTYQPYNYGTLGVSHNDGGYAAASASNGMHQRDAPPVTTFTTREGDEGLEENIVSDVPISYVNRDPFHDSHAVAGHSCNVSFGGATTSSPARNPVRTVGSGPAAVGYGTDRNTRAPPHTRERSGSSLSLHSTLSTSSGGQTVPALSDADYDVVRGSLTGFPPITSASSVPLQAFQPRSVPKSLFVGKTLGRTFQNTSSNNGGALPYRSTGPGGINLTSFPPNPSTCQRRERERDMKRISEATESVYSSASYDGNWQDAAAPPVPDLPSTHAPRPSTSRG